MNMANLIDEELTAAEILVAVSEILQDNLPTNRERIDKLKELCDHYDESFVDFLLLRTTALMFMFKEADTQLFDA